MEICIGMYVECLQNWIMVIFSEISDEASSDI